MKAALVIAAALAAGVNGAAVDLEARQRRTSTRNVPGAIPDVAACGLDAFVGHTSEALLFCSSILKGGTGTITSTYTARTTTTVQTTVITTLYPPTSSTAAPAPPPTTTVPPVTSQPPPSTQPPNPPPSSSAPPAPPSSSAPPAPPPTSTPAPGGPDCGIVGYTKNTAAYYFDSSGTKNTWAACAAQCKGDSKCKSFGYGEANCMLFDVGAKDNTNYNPMSPYTFYDAACPEELPVKLKARQVNISLGLPGGPAGISSACACLVTNPPYDATRTATVTVTSIRVTQIQTVTRTVSLLPPAAPKQRRGIEEAGEWLVPVEE